ncbi:hypothetical protein ACX0G7_21125 [Flavitalea antarctica]
MIEVIFPRILKIPFLRYKDMKKYQTGTRCQLFFVVATVCALCFASCTRNVYVHHTPPGHAKKANGSKSAKAYAPGQKKKH